MAIEKFEIRKPDGRVWIQYSRMPFPEDFAVKDPGLLRPESWQPPHVRYNKMRDEWTAISASRQERPFLPPKEYCPLCPQGHLGGDTSTFQTEVPTTDRIYEWAVFENMFPGLEHERARIGKCEVVLYSPRHESTLGDESIEQIEGLVEVWQDRSRSIGALPNIEYVFIFENKGPEVGVTLHHPHGQIYAFHHVPPFIEREHAAARDFYKKNQRCLICNIVETELEDHRRIVLESESLVAFVPYAARYPYEIHITTKRHVPLIEQMASPERLELATMLKRLTYKYDHLFEFRMPYICVQHQAGAKENSCPHYHWHMEFYPPYRNATKLKYLAGVESGTGLFINDTIPEEKAAELKAIVCPF
jgi:UDPglucose--hexose-1-phosphate uridylyltransferase